MDLAPLVLQSSRVRLEPLQPHHFDPLVQAIGDGELWTVRETLVPHPRELPAFFEAADRAMEAGLELVFATVDRERERVVGSTRFMTFHRGYRTVEIGYTFLAQSAQRTGINRHAKFLMLAHAFERLRLNRVEWLTDVNNLKSRRAIEALGARLEGVLRSHMVMPDGRVRDSAVYSIVRDEWPEARRHLAAAMDAPRP